MSIQIKDFGKTTAGQPVKVGILANDTIEVHILSYGATIQPVSYTHLTLPTKA